MTLDEYILGHIDAEGDYLHSLWRDTQLYVWQKDFATGPNCIPLKSSMRTRTSSDSGLAEVRTMIRYTFTSAMPSSSCLGCRSGTVLLSYDRAHRNEAIRKLRGHGLSVRQIERMTGISRSVIQRVAPGSAYEEKALSRTEQQNDRGHSRTKK